MKVKSLKALIWIVGVFLFIGWNSGYAQSKIRYLNSQEILDQLPEAQEIQKELDDYWPVFFDRLLPHFKTDLSEAYLKKQCEYEYRKEKAKVLNLPTFEEWKNRINVST